MSPRFLSHFGVLFLSLYGSAQSSLSPNYPRNYFSNPLHTPISLAANFGELRQNHFHMGLDIRTEKKENLPVLAAADGYIARIRVEPFGFGQAIYINHPNGYTTVYAHLNKFFPVLETYVKQEQYKKESWKIYLEIPPGMFPVKKGSLIAYSGNTGGSQGPHLHFEIRNTADDTNLNPMLFGLPIADNTRPTIQRIAIYDARLSVYDQSPKIISLVKSGNGFTTGRDTIQVSSPEIALSISAFDTQSGSENPNGVYEATLFENDKPMISFKMDKINYQYTRNINGHIDYKTKAQGGPWLQQLFLLPGLENSIYHPFHGTGSIDLSDGALHSIGVEVKDAYGNVSSFHQKFLYNGQKQANNQALGRIILPGMLEPIEMEECAFVICEKCLYDSVHLNYSKTSSFTPGSVSSVHSIGSYFIPLEDNMVVRIKSNRALSNQEKKRVVMQRKSGKDIEIKKVEWQGDWASEHFRDFGDFQLILDTISPQIRLLGRRNRKKNTAQISFVVTDNLEQIKSVRATVDGQWLRFTNDKEKAFIYVMDEHWPPGKHELKINAEDEAGNMASASFLIDGR
ncbi:MAG: peptidoglycan DD-metalloendopeptidase family protein [Chitinophagales bacterium]